MTIYEFKRLYKEKNPEGNFFNRDSMKFWGRRESGMKVISTDADVWKDGEKHKCYVIEGSIDYYGQRQEKMYYFDSETLKQIPGKVIVKRNLFGTEETRYMI